MDLQCGRVAGPHREVVLVGAGERHPKPVTLSEEHRGWKQVECQLGYAAWDERRSGSNAIPASMPFRW